MDSDTYSWTSAQDKVTMTGRFRLFPLAPLQLSEPLPPLQPPEPPPKKEYKLTHEPPDTEFRKEFPPDPTIGSELDEAARVWKVYRKEAKAFDDMLLDGWSDTLDILLIFVSTVIMVFVDLAKIVPEAGLFSAVATAFVIESYQFLQLDNAAYAAVALYILVTASNHSTGLTLPPPPDLTYKSSLSLWINGLWFTSILLSLSVALLSILAKQWITQYRARNNASAKSPKDWVLRREVYFQALNTWHIAEVVAFLPFLLHLSLFLFFAGVVAFLWTLDKAIGIWIIVLGGSLCVFYIACTLIPLWVPQCPTSTPLSTQMRTSALTLIATGFTVIIAAFHLVQQTKSSILVRVRNISSRPSRVAAFCDRYKHVLSRLADGLAVITYRTRGIRRAYTSDPNRGVDDVVIDVDLATGGDSGSESSDSSDGESSATGDSHNVPTRVEKAAERLKVIRDDKSGIRHHLEQKCHQLEADALHWLIVEVSDSDAVAVGLQSLGAFHWNSPVVDILRTRDRLVDVPDDIAFTRSGSGHTSSEVLRVIRSALCMRRDGQRVTIWTRVHSLTQGNHVNYPDLGMLYAGPDLLHGSADLLALNVAAWRDASPSVESTALHAIRGDYSSFRLVYLLYCDLARFSVDDWDLALNAAEDDVDVNLIPQFAKAFCLAVTVGGSHSRFADPAEHPWVDPLLRRILECAERTDFRGSYNLLPTSTLDLLSSQRFLDAIPNKRIPTILSYFFYHLDFAMRSATAESMLQFWAAFACVARRMKISDDLSDDDTVLLRMCTAALRTWRGSDGIRTELLNAILLPLQLAPSISQSIWERFRDQYVIHGQLEMLELADALAAGLCISVRVSQNPIQTAGWIDHFFAWSKHFVVDILSSFYLIRETHDGRIVHLMQHCEELRPQWLDGQDMDFNGSGRSALAQIREMAAQRGSCKACPEHLGYPPVPPRSVA